MVQQLGASFRLLFGLRLATGSSEMCQSDHAEKDARGIVPECWQGGGETTRGKGQLTVSLCRGTFPSLHSGFLVGCLMLAGTVGDFQPFLVTSPLQKRGLAVFKLCLTHSQKNPQP